MLTFIAVTRIIGFNYYALNEILVLAVDHVDNVVKFFSSLQFFCFFSQYLSYWCHCMVQQSIQWRWWWFISIHYYYFKKKSIVIYIYIQNWNYCSPWSCVKWWSKRRIWDLIKNRKIKIEYSNVISCSWMVNENQNWTINTIEHRKKWNFQSFQAWKHFSWLPVPQMDRLEHGIN